MLLLVAALSQNRPAISSGIRQSLEVDLGVGRRFRRRYPVMAGVGGMPTFSTANSPAGSAMRESNTDAQADERAARLLRVTTQGARDLRDRGLVFLDWLERGEEN